MLGVIFLSSFYFFYLATFEIFCVFNLKNVVVLKFFDKVKRVNEAWQLGNFGRISCVFIAADSSVPSLIEASLLVLIVIYKKLNASFC